ncbi:MAG: glycosyltransferase [Clostridiaceae bacterium]|nr:glycosyltransferase [Clostridiaceae bacterium]
MSLVFVHDHKFRKIKGKFYSPGGLSNEVLTRYTDIFGQVIVVGRIIEEEKLNLRYSEITNENIKIVTAQNLSSYVSSSDALIARLPSINGYKALHLAKRMRKPYLVEVVGCTLDAYWNYGVKGKIAAYPAFLCMRRYVKNAPYAVYVTQEFLQRRYPCNGKTIGISDVALQKVDDSVLDKRLEHIEKRDKSRLVIGTIGAVDVTYKGQEYVIKAIKEIEQKLHIKVEYQMVGVGTTDRLSKIAEDCGLEDRVKFLGTIPHDKVFDWLDSIDIYLQPSLLEGLSRSIVEAMSRGIPCIVSKVGGNVELIDSEYCIDMRKGNISHRLGDTVIRICKLDEFEYLAKLNYSKAVSEYSVDVLNEKRNIFYSDFFSKL